MIFYFSGTGNSLYITKQIAHEQNVEYFSMADKFNKKELIFVPREGEPIGFVFPVYAWGPPRIVLDFVKYVQIARKNNYIFSVAVCSINAGNTNELFREALMENSIPLNADFTVKMPNSNIMVHDVPTRIQQEEILEKADKTIEHINEVVARRKNISETEKGKIPKFKTAVINPVYKKLCHKASRYFFTTQYCESCGFCADICPMMNISMDERGKIFWGDNCIGCLACINRCPRKAIECGKVTTVRARYYNLRGDKEKDRV